MGNVVDVKYRVILAKTASGKEIYFVEFKHLGDWITLETTVSDNLNTAKKIIDRFIEKDNEKSGSQIVSKEVVDI